MSFLFSYRNYYGSKIAMYFAWLGFYTQMLVIPSIIGLFIFIYGVAYMDDSYPRFVILTHCCWETLKGEHRQTVQTHIRCRFMQRLIRVCTVY